MRREGEILDPPHSANGHRSTLQRLSVVLQYAVSRSFFYFLVCNLDHNSLPYVRSLEPRNTTYSNWFYMYVSSPLQVGFCRKQLSELPKMLD